LEFAGPEGVARARAYGTETGQAQGGAQAALPQAAGDLQRFNEIVDGVINDPYLPSMVGPIDSKKPNLSADSARFMGRIEQLTGEAFLAARAKLKGGGAITDMEGQKAENALMRAKLAMNETDYKSALEEAKMHMARGFEILQQQAAGGINPGNTKRLKYNPVTGRAE
jgi:hypothetical protein